MPRLSVFAGALIVSAAFAASALAQQPPAEPQAPDLEDTLYLELDCGRVVMELRPDLAPNHVARIKQLARDGFYDGLTFHRVLEGFMAQTGDPTGTGGGGSNLPDLNQEFSTQPFVRGSVGAARLPNPYVNSANSQFFIMFVTDPRYIAGLTGNYTYFGRVTSGMECVDQIQRVDPQRPDPSIVPWHIISLDVAADVQ